MTVRFLQPWNGYQIGARATLSAAIETTLKASGIARDDYQQDGPVGGSPVLAVPGDGGIAVSAGTVTVSDSSRGGATIALFGDSLMLNNHSTSNPASAISYDAATGIITVPLTSHGLYTGQPVNFVVKAQPDWNLYRAPVTRVDANTITLQGPTGLTNVPATLSRIWIAYCDVLMIFGPYAWLPCRRPTLVKNLGVTGETAAEIRARLPHVRATPSDIVDFRAGTNDVIVGSLTADQIFADIEYVVQQLAVVDNRQMIVHTVPPLGSTANTGTRMLVIDALNRKILGLKSKYRNVQICDDYAALVDPTSAVGSALSNVIGSDGIHFTGRAGKLISARFAACLKSYLGDAVPQHPVSAIAAYDATNNPAGYDAWANGLLKTTTGGTTGSNCTGTVAQALSVSSSNASAPVVASVVATDYGNAQRVVGAPAANGDLFIVTLNSVHARVVAGEKRRFQVRVKTTGAAANAQFKTLGILLNIGTADGTFTQVRHLYQSGGTVAYWPQEEIDMLLETEPFVIPAGVTSVVGKIQCEFGGAGSSVTLDISQIGFPLEI